MAMICDALPRFSKRSLLIITFLVSLMQVGSVPGLLAQSGHVVPSMVGKLIAMHGNYITVRNDELTETFQVSPETTIWRGRDVGVRQLRVGDNLAIRYSVSSGNGETIATAIWVNTDRWAGTIKKVSGDRVQIAVIDDHGDPAGKATIIFNSYTTFSEWISKDDLHVGRFLETTGLVVGKRQMQAAKVLHIDPVSN